MTENLVTKEIKAMETNPYLALRKPELCERMVERGLAKNKTAARSMPIEDLQVALYADDCRKRQEEATQRAAEAITPPGAPPVPTPVPAPTVIARIEPMPMPQHNGPSYPPVILSPVERAEQTLLPPPRAAIFVDIMATPIPKRLPHQARNAAEAKEARDAKRAKNRRKYKRALSRERHGWANAQA